MKRHEALAPFSRDHNVGLVLARKLSRIDDEDVTACRSLADEVLAFWRDELHDHFVEEERLLSELASPESVRTLGEEHRAIERSVERLAKAPVAEELRNLGGLLEAHIRWEERSLFVEIERCAAPDQLQDLARESAEIERKRAHSSWAPRRAELMRRRRASPQP